MSNNKLIQKAKKEFGLTHDFREAGFILPDGGLLDFSGKREGGPAYERQMDHREICRIYDKPPPKGKECFEVMEKRGLIRFGLMGSHTRQPQVNVSLNTFQKPTEKQVTKMRQSISVCRQFGPCDLAYDVFLDNGDRCISRDEGYVENASMRDVNSMLSNLHICKIRNGKSNNPHRRRRRRQKNA